MILSKVPCFSLIRFIFSGCYAPRTIIMRLYTQHFSRIFCQSRNQNGVYFVHCMAFIIRCNAADKCLCNEFYKTYKSFLFFCAFRYLYWRLEFKRKGQKTNLWKPNLGIHTSKIIFYSILSCQVRCNNC